jgi:site-specific recombinase XerD
MTFDDLTAGFFLARRRTLRPTTQRNYQWAFKLFAGHVGNIDAASIAGRHVEAFLNAQFDRGLSRRSLSDLWVALSSLWSWAVKADVGVTVHPLANVARPRFPKPEIVIFSVEQCRAIIRAAEWAAPWTGKQGKPTRSRRATYKRDKALILVMLDTGIRVQELCDLRVGDYDAAERRLHVREGKGGKERTLAMGDTAALALWAYMASRPAALPAAPLFSTGTNNPLDRGNVEKLLKRIGNNAGVADVHPHRFRHTFAVRYVLNGGDVHTLRLMLGHETLDMAITYMHMASHDVQAVQRSVSPADAVFNGKKR